MAAVTTPSNTPIATIAYGPDGARAKKAGSTSTTLYPNAGVEIDATQPIGSGNAANNDITYISSAYTRYPHMDIKVVGNEKFWLHRDHLSSVRMVTDAAGTVVESTNYGPYGERKNTGFQTQKSYIPSRHLLRNCLPGIGTNAMNPNSD